MPLSLRPERTPKSEKRHTSNRGPAKPMLLNPPRTRRRQKARSPKGRMKLPQHPYLVAKKNGTMMRHPRRTMKSPLWIRALWFGQAKPKVVDRS